VAFSVNISNSLNKYKRAFAPSRLPEVFLWLHLNDSSQYVLDSGTIAEWKNAVDSDNDYTNGSVTRSPTLVGGPLTALKDKSLSFDGGDYLVGAVPKAIGGPTAGTFAIVYTNANWAAASAQVIIGDDNTNNSFVRSSSATNFTFKAYDGSTTSSKGLATDVTLVNGQFYVFIVTVSLIGNVKMYIDGVLQSNSPTFNPAESQLIIQEIGAKNGPSQPLTGSVKEVVATTAVLTDSERIKLNSYLGHRHGIL